MNGIKKHSLLAVVWMVMVALSCSDDPNNPDEDPGPGPGPGTGNVTITGVSADYVFWGEELTINGTGFSTVKEQNLVKFTSVWPTATFCPLKYTSESDGDIEIISATATQLKIKVPLELNSSGDPVCGPESANLEVTVNSNKATFNDVKFSGLLRIDNFLYHYGWFDIPGVTRIGDSVMIAGGLMGYNARTSPLWNKTKLTIDGNPVAIKYRTIGLESGWSFYLPANIFGEINCDTSPDDWGARYMSFTFSLEGTDKSVSRNLLVQYLPEQTAYCTDCPTTYSKSAGGGSGHWNISGKDMYYSSVVFTSGNCGGTPLEVDLPGSLLFSSEFSFPIPFGSLAANCSYSVSLKGPCDETQHLGTVNIIP